MTHLPAPNKSLIGAKSNRNAAHRALTARLGSLKGSAGNLALYREIVRTCHTEGRRKQIVKFDKTELVIFHSLSGRTGLFGGVARWRRRLENVRNWPSRRQVRREALRLDSCGLRQSARQVSGANNNRRNTTDAASNSKDS